MQLHVRCLFRCTMVVAALFAVSVDSSLAGPSDYTVTRSFSEQSLCDETTSSSSTVELTGAGTGSPGDMLTVIETLLPFPGGGDLSDLTIVAGQGGMVDSIEASPTSVFDAVLLIEHPLRESLGENNGVVFNGQNSYTSTAETGRDVWAPGDTFVYAYNLFDGDFDVSVRIDDYRYNNSDGSDPGSEGCWGKYGIMARRTLDSNSEFAQISDHTGPAGTLPGALSHCNAPPPGHGSCANFFGRRIHLSDGGQFETNPVLDPCFAPYLRLVRQGDLIQGYVSDDPLVEVSPTNDALWTTRPDITHNVSGGGSEWFVGFANHDHVSNGLQVQEVDFTLIKWDPPGDGGAGDGGGAGLATQRKITWNVPRSTVTSGLSYTLENSASQVTARHAGIVGTASVAGPAISHTEGVQTQQVGDFISRTVGETGAGVSTYDGPSDTYTMTGGGIDIGNGGDSMNFLYTQVTGDFIATAQILSRDLQGGDSGKYGLMARQNCHPDSRHEFIASDRSADGTRHTERLDPILPDADTNRAVYIVEPGVVPGSPEEGAPAVPGNPLPATNPDHLMLIRTGSQITSYVAWDDPGNPGQPFHWCLVGSTNHPDRPDDLFVGMAVNAGGTADPVSSIDFEMDIESYSPTPQSLFPSALPVFELDFDAESDGDFPDGGVLSRTQFTGTFTPVVRDGKLRMTQDEFPNMASAAYWTDPALENILDTGFVAEFDVSASSNADPGEGGTFVVIASGTDLLDIVEIEPPPVDETPVGVFQNRVLIEHPMREARGTNNSTVHVGGDTYVSTAETGRDIWAPGDTVEFAYNEFEGDFDLVVRIDDYSHVDMMPEDGDNSNQGCWGKYGIMARRTLDSNSLMCVIADHTGPEGTLPGAQGCTQPPPGNGSCASFFGRSLHLNNGGQFESAGNLDPCFAPYLRLARQGSTIRGYVSAFSELEDDIPTDDFFWTQVGAPFNSGDGGACWRVGFCNHDHETAGVQVQTVEFTLIKWDGTLCGSTVPEQITTVFGDAGAGLGFGGEVSPDEANRLRQVNECHPMFALEFDTLGVQSVDRIQFAGVNNEGSGSPDAPGTYHIGLDTNSSTASRQINEQLGVAPGALPDLFDPVNPVHIKLEYKPNGEIRAWASTGQGGGAGVPDTLVIDTYIPPLTLGAGLGEPLVGFTGATGALTQTLEFDNLTITRLTGDGTPVGACCTAGDCDVQTQADCEAGGGTYQGDGVTCGGVTCPAGGGFKRGDGDASGTLNINDPIFNLIFQFLGGVTPVCKDALDTDDSGTVTINDPIISLTFQFLGGVTIPLPGPDDCGPDPTNDNEDCAAYPQDKCQ